MILSEEWFDREEGSFTVCDENRELVLEFVYRYWSHTKEIGFALARTVINNAILDASPFSSFSTALQHATPATLKELLEELYRLSPHDLEMMVE